MYNFHEYERQNPDLSTFLPWWREATNREPHLVPLDASFEQNLLFAIIATNSTPEPIGAAAIMEARTKDNVGIIFQDKKVVELGSNFVENSHRGNGLAKTFLLKRLELCLKNDWFPVSVTTNLIVKHMFESIGAQVMSDPSYKELVHMLCMCKNGPKACNFCPYEDKAAWYFPRSRFP